MKNKAVEESIQLIKIRWGQEKADSIRESVYNHLTLLCEENRDDCREMKKYTEKDIFPCISLYRALEESGVGREEAAAFLDESWSIRARSGADGMRKILKIPGLYKLYPAVFQKVAQKQYGQAAGFEKKIYYVGKRHCRFDMTKCLYCDVCRKYGCPELVKCFCHVDDVNNGNLHPGLCWNRTMYMGGGGSCCDFDIFVRDIKK